MIFKYVFTAFENISCAYSNQSQYKGTETSKGGPKKGKK